MNAGFYGTPVPFAKRAPFKPAPFRPRRMGDIPPVEPPNTTSSSSSTNLTTGEKTVIAGALVAGTGISGLIAYYAIRAGLKEKDFLAVLGWVIGVPAAISAAVGLFALGGFAYAGLKS